MLLRGWRDISLNNVILCPLQEDYISRREVYQAYKDDMLLDIVPFIQYQHFNRLWRLQFNNVVIPRKVHMGVCSVCANLKSMAKSGRTDVEINVKNRGRFCAVEEMICVCV